MSRKKNGFCRVHFFARAPLSLAFEWFAVSRFLLSSGHSLKIGRAICSQTPPPLILPFGVRAVPDHHICGQSLISNRIFRHSVFSSVFMNAMIEAALVNPWTCTKYSTDIGLNSLKICAPII